MTTIKTIQETFVGQKYKPGITFDVTIAVPESDVDEYALLIEHDGQNNANVNSMLMLADEGKAP